MTDQPTPVHEVFKRMQLIKDWAMFNVGLAVFFATAWAWVEVVRLAKATFS